MRPRFKTVNIQTTIKVRDDQPVEDWFPAAIEENLTEEGESILSYADDEEVVNASEPS